MRRATNNTSNQSAGAISIKDGDYGKLRNDNVFVTSEVKQMTDLLPAGVAPRKGYDKGIISNGKLVNIVSSSYGHLPNENYFLEVETKLIDAGVEFVKRSINKDDRAFAVDYILKDDNYVIKVKNANDQIVPMLRFTNSYDGSAKTTGHFGFFRKVCENGLHIANTEIGFAVKHSSLIDLIVLPEINGIIERFMNNEFYQLSRKFEVLAERPITDLKEFVKITAEQTKIFQYVKSENNPLPSLNAERVMDVITNEANLLGVKPNMWLGYNAFNNVLHNTFEKSFEVAKTLDAKVFDFVMQLN